MFMGVKIILRWKKTEVRVPEILLPRRIFGPSDRSRDKIAMGEIHNVHYMRLNIIRWLKSRRRILTEHGSRMAAMKHATF
jgi:hypothetical protein